MKVPNARVHVLIGSTFPTSLIIRRVVITPRSLGELRVTIDGKMIHSFWGHQDTLQEASDLVGINLAPASERPALKLDPAGLPFLDGISFEECWLLSPIFPPGYRPALDGPAPGAAIEGWRVLQINWENA